MAKNINVKYILGLDVNEFRTGMQRVSGTLNNMQNQFNNLGRTIGGVFAGYQIKQFTQEAIEMGSALQKATAGFARFGDEADLEGLRQSTRGLLTDLELMNQAVKGANLGIPLKEMGTLLEFAKRRADETGESIDYLVNSIVEGIGRKSTRRLDNLGISADRVTKALNGVSLEAATVEQVSTIMATIATEELGKMGKPIETAADEMARLRVEFQNFKAELGVGIGDIFVKSWKNYSNLFKMLNAFAKGEYKQALGFGAMLVPSEKDSELGFIPTDGKPKKKIKTAVPGPTEEEIKKGYQMRNQVLLNQIALYEQMQVQVEETFKKELLEGWIALELEEIDLLEGEMVPILEKVAEKYDNINLIAQQFGHIMTSSFQAAIQSGEDFFDVMAKALKAYVQQLMAAVAATAALSVVSMAFGGGTFLQAFKKVGVNTGLSGFFGGNQEFIGRVSGFELLLQQNRMGKNASLINGN
jgi:hypothetical protein